MPTYRTGSEEETIALGENLARDFPARAVVLLIGNLGAGKTTLAKGIVKGLKAGDPEQVSSPTFTLIHEYPVASSGRPMVYHVDLYRLTPDEVDDLGLDDLVSGEGVVAIEWAERWRGRPDDVVEVRLAEVGDTERSIEIRMGQPR